MNFDDPRLPDRFWAKCVPEPNSGCWLWLGAITRGHGKVSMGGRLRYTHIVAYEAACGLVPEGLVLDHKCRQRCCCNPRHLEPVTQRVNVLRGIAGEQESSKTECPAGHPYDNVNTIWKSRRGGMKYRKCRECSRQHWRKYKRRVRGAAKEI